MRAPRRRSSSGGGRSTARASTARSWPRSATATRPWSAATSGSHDDPRLRRRDAAAAAQLTDRLVEVRGVRAGELDDVVEAAGDERDGLRGGGGEGHPPELVGVPGLREGGGGETRP